METPQKRQKSWFSSLTGLVSGNRSSDATATVTPTAGIKARTSTIHSGRASLHTRARRLDETPARHPGTFSAPPFDSPESPAKRASPSQMAQRKIHDRVQGPSSRIGDTSLSNRLVPSTTTPDLHIYGSNVDSSAFGSMRLSSSLTPRRSMNFTSANTPRNKFRDSMSRELPSFTFTPRVPPNTMRGNFPAVTPGRSYRAPGIELSAREMAKVSSSDLFPMKIPDPDVSLSGQAIADMVPKDLRAANRSIYANEYLAHLCPPDFNEEQRNQFFCILDLRRLKYAADEVFQKKDWRLNILNFAKEYEKNRSLIMLRYGLYEFKTVKVSKDIFEKWKAANNIPDVEDEEAEEAAPVVLNSSISSKPSHSAPSLIAKPNGTEGILRVGKRKAQDTNDLTARANSSLSSVPTNKRPRPLSGRPTEREPLAETTSSSALNKSKRKAVGAAGVDEKREKYLKSAKNDAPTSATKSFLEKVANSPAKDGSSVASTATPVSTLFSAAKPAGLTKSSTLGQLPKASPNTSLARSVLESGLKNSASTNNIFGYLSDTSSVNNGNPTVDEGSDADSDEGEHDAQKTAKPVDASLSQSSSVPRFGFKSTTSEQLVGSSVSSQASEAPSSRSLFDRVNKDSGGQPIRVLSGEGGSTAEGLAAPPSLFGSKPNSGQTSPEKETQPALLFGAASKIWNTDTPIKFAPATTTTAANSTLPAPAKPLFGAVSTPSTLATQDTHTTTSPSFKFSAASTTAPPSAFDSSNSQTNGTTLFGLTSKLVEPKATTITSAPSLFPASDRTSTLGTTNPISGNDSATVSAAPTVTDSTPTASAAPTAPANGDSAATFGQPQTLLGKTSNTETSFLSSKRGADYSAQPPAKSSFGGTGSSLFGSAMKSSSSDKDEAPSRQTLFGNAAQSNSTTDTAIPSSKSLFSFGTAKASGEADMKNTIDATVPKPQEAKPISSNSTEPSKMPALFGSTVPATTSGAASSLFMFGNGNHTNSSTSSVLAPTLAAPIFTFGSSAAQPQTGAAPAQSSFTSTPSFGGGGNDTGSANSSFTFNVAAGGSQPFTNPFATASGGNPTAISSVTPSTSFSFGAGGTNGQTVDSGTSSLFQFGGGDSSAAPAISSAPAVFSYSRGPQQASPAPTGNLFGNSTAPTSTVNATGSPSLFNFGAGGTAQPSSGAPLFNLAPPMGGTSTGTNTPFTNLGGASSLATTPATGTPEPGATQDNADNSGHQADGDEASQVQISLTDGGPGEEDEAVVYEVRAKVLHLVSAHDEPDSGDSPTAASAVKKSPWKTEGVGPLRVLKHKATGAARLLLRGEPRGHVALNRALLPDFKYKPEPNAKYVKLTTANETGSGLETWMVQVKTKEAAQKLADVLEEHKGSSKK